MIAPLTLVGLLLVGIAPACTSDDASASSTIAPVAKAVSPTTVASSTTPPSATTTVPTPAATAPATSPATAPPPTAPPTTAPDGASVLQQAFDQLAAGYHFVTTATVNGTPALTAEGDQVAGNTRMSITSQGKTIDYIVLPDSTWVADNGDWQELAEPAPAGDPISALRAPQSVTVASYTPELTTLTAAYPPSALALTGDQPVNVSFELAGTTLMAIAYAVPGTASSVRAEISPVANATPITSPSPGG